jgi:hypothetical protein
MQYTQKDFLAEMTHYYGKSTRQQQLASTVKPTFLSCTSEEPMIGEKQKYLLRLNEICRVEKDTPYKVHKGYPSPRSLYPIKLFMALGEEHLLSIQAIYGRYEYYHDPEVSLKKGDLLLLYTDIYPEYYQYIKKTLLILETGHLLYNIFQVASLLGLRYALRTEKERVILEWQKESLDQATNVPMIEAFLQRCQVRNSGPYRHLITVTQAPVMGNITDFDQLLEQALTELSDHFAFPLHPGRIRVITLFNDGGGNFYSSHPDLQDIEYQQLNTIYPHINFYGVRFFTVFLLANEVFTSDQAALYLLSLGYLAQAISIKYANRQHYCRPIKSYHLDRIETFLGIDSGAYTAFYCLVSGPFSAESGED